MANHADKPSGRMRKWGFLTGYQARLTAGFCQLHVVFYFVSCGYTQVKMRCAFMLLSAAIAVAEPLQRAHLIVDKAITAPNTKDVIVKDEPFTVTYTLVNLGERHVQEGYCLCAHECQQDWTPCDSPTIWCITLRVQRQACMILCLSYCNCSDATDVSVKDSFPEAMFTVVSGTSGLEIGRIESKANYTTQLVLIPKVSGMMTVSRAEVTYHYAEDGDVMEAKAQSSTIGRVEIVSRYVVPTHTHTTLNGHGLLSPASRMSPFPPRRQVFDLEVADHSVPLGALFLTALATIVGPYYLYSTAPAR